MDDIIVLCAICHQPVTVLKIGVGRYILTDVVCGPCLDRESILSKENQTIALENYITDLNRRYLAEHPDIYKKAGE